MSQRTTDILDSLLGRSGGTEDSELEDDWYDSKFAKRFDMLAYKIFGEYISDDEDAYAGYRRAINQARMDVVYDIYLSRIFLSTSVTALLGLVLGVVISASLASAGVFESVSVSLRAPGPIESFFSSYSSYILGGLVSILSASILGGSVAGVMYYIPKYRAGERGRKIDRNLPSAITFMYALSRGGMNVIEVMEKLADADEVYGEVSNEFDMILRDMDYFGSDLRVALRNAADMTPSGNFKTFMDDLLSVIDSGGDITPFLYTKSQRYHEIRKQDQEGFLNTLALMAEAYVVAFVAAPLFVMVIVSIMTLMGGAQVFIMYIIVYTALPLATLGFITAIDLVSTGEDQSTEKLEKERAEFGLDELEENAEEADDEMLDELAKAKKMRMTKDFLEDPLSKIRKEPTYSLAVTVPVAILSAVLSVYTGLSGLSIAAFLDDPVTNTTYLAVIPLFICMIPLSYFHEKNVRKEKQILAELPETLRKLKSSNETGMTLNQSFALVSDTSSGILSRELGKVHNQIRWGSSLNDALIGFANRMRISRLSRTIKLITKANESSGNLQKVLEVAARDADSSYKLDRKRFQEMIIYTVIIILTFLVFLFVIYMLDKSFLSEMAEVSGTQTGGEGPSNSGAGGSFTPNNIPIETFRMVFFHASIVQALFSGFVAGQMGENSMLSGLKYSIVMIMIALVVFMFI